MSVVCTPDLKDKLHGNNLLLDTCTIIDGSKCAEFDSFLGGLLKEDCTFLSLPSVKEEFTCSAFNLDDYNKLVEYIKSLQIVFLPNMEKKLISEDNSVFNIALRRYSRTNQSHVDRMLLTTVYYYSGSSEKVYLMTSNHKDVPDNIYSLVGFITYESKGFHNVGIYEFDQANYERVVENIKSESR